MIDHLQLIRNIGLFDSVTTVANTPLGRLTLIYAENGRGKTTLAAILRSLATGNPIPIMERRRLAAQHSPHVIIGCAGGPPDAMFQNGAWNRTLPTIVVFDDEFVDQNVYSGLVVDSAHRQNLHEFILGAQGVALSQRLQAFIAQVEACNRVLREREAAIPGGERRGLSVNDFCALPSNANVEQEIQAAERNLAAARDQEPVRSTPAFDPLSLPAFDLAAIELVLQAGVPELDAAAAARVQEHLATVGRGAEQWIAAGMQHQAERPPHAAGECVFCAQDLAGSPVIGHYRAFFSDAYRQLQHNILDSVGRLDRVHAGNAAASLERAVRVLGERKQFWSRFADMPEIRVDTVAILFAWQATHRQLAELLAKKQAAPLDRIAVPESVRAVVQVHEENRAAISLLNLELLNANQRIEAVKRRAAAANPAAIAATLTRLQVVKARHVPATAALCDAYLAERRAKAATERQRDHARAALEDYRANVFPNYEAAINRYLTCFSTGFHLDSITAVNTRGGPTCTYNVVINNTAIAVAGGNPQPGDHSFRNTLSAGDRNALALAFFFASLELDPNLANRTVVIDDPVSSLDDHRSLTTVQEIRRLAMRVAQVLVLSHAKPFLCRLLGGPDPAIRVALQVIRDGDGSTIVPWNVDQDSITDHDRRHAALREYLGNGGLDDREIAHSIRLLLEAFFRVAYPEHFPPGTLLGPFRGLCEQRLNTAQPILNVQDIQEFRDIVEYANRFHHDTNPAWQNEVINAAELTEFVTRVLAFTKRR